MQLLIVMLSTLFSGTDRDFDPQRLDILAAIWVVVKHLDAGFGRRICTAILVRVNFAVAVFIPQPIEQEFGSLRAFMLPMVRDASIVGFAPEGKTAHFGLAVSNRSREAIGALSQIGHS